MKDTYIVRVYNTITKKVESVEVSKEIYEVYTRTMWNIADNNKSFYGHEIQMTGLIGGDDNAFENFHEFIDTENTPENIALKSEKMKEGFKTLDVLSPETKKRFIEHYYYGIFAKRIAKKQVQMKVQLTKLLYGQRKKLKKF